MSDTISSATMLMTLIIGLMAGPAVSLHGSPTVSPVTAALCVSVPLRPCSSMRSEEHTSELQSLAYLVCRLLLEKKKRNTAAQIGDAVALPAWRSPACGVG